MADRLYTSSEADEVLSALRFETKLEKATLARIAFALSLVKDGCGVAPSPSFSGGEMKRPTFVGEDEVFLRTLIAHAYGKRDFSEDEFFSNHSIVKNHIDSGTALLEKMFQEAGRSGEGLIRQLVDEVEFAGRREQLGSGLDIFIGRTLLQRTELVMELNNTTKHANSHLAIMGKPGVGKTQFLLKILTDIRIQSNYQTNFIYFDYKGDVVENARFQELARVQSFRLLQGGQSLPINPFILPAYDEQTVNVSAREKAESFASINSKLGVVQKGALTEIPLNKLARSEDNVRKTATANGIAEMAASIKAHGLQQNLVVRRQGKKFGVIDGGRRYEALLQLAEDGTISKNLPIPCKVDESSIDGKELSLIANTIREDMHPADQFEAFKALVDNGQSTADVAARRGCPESHVVKLLKLANCSPVLLKAYREEQLSLEQLMAYAVTDDHEAQERVFQQESDHASTFHIRRLLTQNEVPGTDKRVCFVGLDTYERNGGAVKRDLFSDDEDGVFVSNVALLDKLASERLERETEPVRNEGWKWIEVRPSFEYQDRSKFQQFHAEPPALSEDLSAEVLQLQDEYDRLIDNEEEHASRLDEIDARLKQIEDGRGEAVFTPEQRAIAGAVVTIGRDGDLRVERGLVRPEDAPADNESDDTPPWDTSEGNTPAKTPASEFSVGLIEVLTAHKSAAISAALLQQPSVGLAVVVHAFVSKLLRGGSDRSCFDIFCSERSFRNVEGSKALQHIEDARAQWMKRLSDGDLWQWCLAQEQQVLVDLLTFCTALMIDAVRRKPDLSNSDRLRHGDMLALALKIDVSDWFTPTADNYFSHVSKRQILEAIFEAKGQPAAPAWEKLKKPELAKVAERQVGGTGWLPKPLRVEA